MKYKSKPQGLDLRNQHRIFPHLSPKDMVEAQMLLYYWPWDSIGGCALTCFKDSLQETCWICVSGQCRDEGSNQGAVPTAKKKKKVEDKPSQDCRTENKEVKHPSSWPKHRILTLEQSPKPNVDITWVEKHPGEEKVGSEASATLPFSSDLIWTLAPFSDV